MTVLMRSSSSGITEVIVCRGRGGEGGRVMGERGEGGEGRR